MQGTRANVVATKQTADPHSTSLRAGSPLLHSTRFTRSGSGRDDASSKSIIYMPPLCPYALEAELCPEQQVAKCRFDCILLIQVAGGADIEEVDVEWSDVVVVGKVLRFDSEDEHAAL